MNRSKPPQLHINYEDYKKQKDYKDPLELKSPTFDDVFKQHTCNCKKCKCKK